MENIVSLLQHMQKITAIRKNTHENNEKLASYIFTNLFITLYTVSSRRLSYRARNFFQYQPTCRGRRIRAGEQLQREQNQRPH